MNKHFNQYININKRTLKLVRELIYNSYFKKRFKKRFQMLINLNKQLSKVYNITTPKIKIIPYNKIRYDFYHKDNIKIGDSLSLVSFLSKFKLNLDYNEGSIDNKEVKSDRDCLDWALSVIKFSDEIMMGKIIKSIEKSILKETVTT